MSRWRQFWVVVPALLALALFIACYPYTNGGRQRYNMVMAKERLPRVQAVIAADPKFEGIRPTVYTAQGGSMALFGEVEADEDLSRLMREVTAMRLPVPVTWMVEVRADRAEE